MKKIKTIVDREPVSSDYIASKQDFGHVLKQVNQMSVPVWKSGWFYGPIGMAVVAVTISITTIDPASAGASVETAAFAETSMASVLPDPVEDHSASANPASTKTEQAQNTQETIQVEDRVPQTVNRTEPAPVSHQETSAQEEVATGLSASNKSIPQAERVAEEPAILHQPVSTKRKNTLAHIESYYTGEIPVSALSSALEVNEDIRIVAFNVHYNGVSGTETASVIGNKIPENVIESIRRYNIGYMVFFTDIKGVTSEGKVISLLSMNFIATNSK